MRSLQPLSQVCVAKYIMLHKRWPINITEVCIPLRIAVLLYYPELRTMMELAQYPMLCHHRHK